MDELEKRFRSNIYGKFPTNCIGSLLHWCGKKKEDRFFNPNSLYDKYFDELEKTYGPKRGDIVLWEVITDDKKRELLHGAVIGNSKLTELYHRPGAYHPSFDENAKARIDSIRDLSIWISESFSAQSEKISMSFYRWKN